MLNCNNSKLTKHASKRMSQRRIPATAIDLVIEYGRVVFTRGAMIYAIGRNEVKQYKIEKAEISYCEGVQVVCSMDGVVLTAYRNQSFRGLRTGLGRGRYRPRKSRINRFFQLPR